MAINGLDPVSNPESWFVVTIAGVASPGICLVTGFKRSAEWDVKKGKGTVGATITYVSKPPAKGSIEFQAWLPRHWDDWDDFLPLFQYDPTKKAVQAVDIFHPALADVGIVSVVTEDIGAWEHKGQGLYSRTVSFLEYAPPPAASAVSTPAGAKADTPAASAGTPPPSAADANQQQINTLLQQAQAP
jgi:hypothetical protein